MPILADVLLKGLGRGTHCVRVNRCARGEPTGVSPTLRNTSPAQGDCLSGEREPSVIGFRSVGVQHFPFRWPSIAYIPLNLG